MPSPEYQETINEFRNALTSFKDTNDIGELDRVLENLYTNANSDEERLNALQELINLSNSPDIPVGLVDNDDIVDANIALMELSSPEVKESMMNQLSTDPSVALKSPLYAAVLASYLGLLKTDDDVELSDESKNTLNDSYNKLEPQDQLDLATRATSMSPAEERKELEQDIFNNPKLVSQSPMYAMIARDAIVNQQNEGLLNIVRNEATNGVPGNVFEKILELTNTVPSQDFRPSTPYDDQMNGPQNAKG
jgi:hypothetical protein